MAEAMSHYGRMKRLTAVFAIVLFTLPACSEAEQARDIASDAAKVRDCAALAADAARAGLEQVGQLDAQSAQEAADRVGQRINDINNTEVRTAAERLREALNAAAEAARTGNAPALEEARQQVTDTAEQAAQTCGLSLDQFAVP
jgi:hypothetical protein